jgi:hypothetical protein
MQQQEQCRACGVTIGVRLFRGTYFILPLCDPCALEHEPTNSSGHELRVRAVALERFDQFAITGERSL